MSRNIESGPSSEEPTEASAVVPFDPEKEITKNDLQNIREYLNGRFNEVNKSADQWSDFSENLM